MSVLAWAQTPTVATAMPYECSFEEHDDLSCWVLNPQTPNAADQWMVGNAVHSDGKRALYISADGQDPNYNKQPDVVVAYLRYKFPTHNLQNPQKYDLSFDWKGECDTSSSKLYVMICPESYFLNNPSNNARNINNIVYESTASTALTPGSGRLSNSTQAVCEYIGLIQPVKYLGGNAEWQNVSLTMPISVNAANSQNNFVIVFIWANANTVESLTRTSICIDNVQINSAQVPKPTNLQAVAQCEDSTMLLTWESGLPEFDIEYRKMGTTTWRKESGLADGITGFTRVDGTQCSYVLRRILEGGYEVRLRGKWDDLTTGLVYLKNILVYCPENHCINYIDLYSPSVVCTYGGNPEYQAGATPFDHIGVLNSGPDQETSRHTLHVDPDELDPRTDSLLHTVPDGALASVRLGNWKTGGEAEAITYDITVDSTSQGILIVKYAVVLENPGDWHKKEEEPRFDLIVLDEAGQTIDELCGQAIFYYSDGANSGWNITKDNNVAWKDWTTVGLNLMPYHGRTIKVRFITYDCGQGGHYAYAYFTVDCANAHIETENCGNDASITCLAPDGFAYEWRDGSGTVVSNEQELSVSASRETYTCRVSFIEQPACYFEISTISAPRFPVPDYTYEAIYGECQSKLKFTNTSHVMNKWEGYENHTSEECNDFHWEFRCLSNNAKKVSDAREPIYLCPQTGDSIEITYTCYIGTEDAPCDSTRVDTIVVPNIIPDRTTIELYTCPEIPVKFDDKWFNTDTVYTATYLNFADCDSVSTLRLKVYPTISDTYRHDSICSDQSLVINGVHYKDPVDNYEIKLKSIHGCDSVVHLTLTVNERIQATIDEVPYACADDGQLFVSFDISAGVFDSLQISFSTPELRDTVIYDPTVNVIEVPYSENITPGRYDATLVFHQFCCGTRTEHRSFDIRYRSSIVEQKWNDVLTLLSPQYNGGYEFTAFQWYKNGEPLQGETHSYLYQPLDMNATYFVELTRTDGVVVTTCPIQPEEHEQLTDYPSIAQPGQRIRVYVPQPVTVRYYTTSGQLYATYDLNAGYGTLEAPATAGVYILYTTDNQGEAKAQKMIVQ